MGNQGMKNWKFSVFFVIALTLVVGLFADTATAASGKGKMALTLTKNGVELASNDGVTLIPAVAANNDATPPTPARRAVLIGGSDGKGENGVRMVFTYTVDNDVNMNGGWIRLDLPDGWSANLDTDDATAKPASYIDSISDGGTNLYMRGARLTDPTNTTILRPANNAGMRGPAAKANRGLRRVDLYDKDNKPIKWSDSTEVRRIEVELDAAAWGADRTGSRSVVITLNDVKVPIPARLDRVGGLNYKSYRFTAWAKSKDVVGWPAGSRLKPYNDATTGKPVEAHPRVNVGNISNADAKAGAIKPAKAYLGDQGDLVITYKAAGPIYDQNLNNNASLADSGDIDAQIVINMAASITNFQKLADPLPKTVTISNVKTAVPQPPVLLKSQVDELKQGGDIGNALSPTTANGGPQATTRGKPGYVSMTSTGSVSFANRPITVNTTNNTVTINIVKMDKDAEIKLTYRKMFAANASDSATLFTLYAVSSGTNDGSTDRSQFGEVAARDGTVKITKDAVKANKLESFDIEFKSTVEISNAYLIVKLPAAVAGETPLKMPTVGNDTVLKTLTLTDGVLGTTGHPPDYHTKPLKDHPNNGDGSTSATGLYGRVSITSNAGNSDVTTDLLDSGSLADGTGYDIVVWGPLKLSANQTFKGKINKARITNATGEYSWTTSVLIKDDGTRPTADEIGAAVSGDTGTSATLCVLQSEANPTNPDVSFEIMSAKELPLSTNGADFEQEAGRGGLGFYDAAGRYRMTFRFTAVSTPVKKGSLKFTIPSGWTAPTKDKKLGYTVIQAATTGENGADGAGVVINADKNSIGRTITIGEVTLPKGKSVDIIYGEKLNPSDNVQDDFVGFRMQPKAASSVKITSKYKVHSSLSEESSHTLNVTVGSAPASSGMAKITPYNVEAGKPTTLDVVFVAEGTMTGGQVVLQMPDGWGDLQNTQSGERNYVQVTGSGLGNDDWDVNSDIVEVNLNAFEKDSKVNFKLKRVVPQFSELGVAEFKISSAGNAGETVNLLVGEPYPEGAYTNEGLILDKLLQPAIGSRVFRTDFVGGNEDRNGVLRVKVASGGAGSGTVGLAIIANEQGSKDYYTDPTDDTTKESDTRFHAGDGAKAHLRFTYTPIATVTDGALRMTVPTGWTPPQAADSTEPGFTQVSSSGTIGTISFASGALIVPITLVNSNNDIVIDYGTEQGGAVPPATTGTGDFVFAVSGDGVTFNDLPPAFQPDSVTVYSQASGKGTAAITTSTNGLYAGQTDGSLTITYTADGQTKNGSLRLKVPAGWSSAEWTLDADSQFVAAENLNLSKGDTHTLTYENVTVQPTAATDIVFEVAFMGGDGPGKDFVKIAEHPKVNVGSTAPGTGMAAITDVPSVVTAGSAGNNITITYTAAGQLEAGKMIKVSVPQGWSAPIAGDTGIGTYTVDHRDANGAVITEATFGTATSSVEKVAPVGRDMIAQVKSGESVAGGQKVIFTYQNATAPATPEQSVFDVSFDGVKLTGDNAQPAPVIVQSAAGVSKLGLGANDKDGKETDTFMIDNKGTLTITVKLLATDNSVATRNTDTVVTPTSSSSTGSFNPATVTIKAGEYMGTTAYSDTTAGNVTINASTTATGVAAAMALAIKANTANPTISAPTFSPMVVKDLDVVTVTAMGTPFQTATFMIETINASGISMTDDGDGTYTGSHTLANGSAEGMHSVSVTVGTNEPVLAAAKLTVDNTKPGVEVTASSEGDTITITATVTDATDVTVSGSVSMQGSEAADSVMLSADATDSTKYTGTHKVSDGAYDITVTATDAAGNEGMDTAMVTIDNAMPTVSASADKTHAKNGDTVMLTATVSEASTVTADVSMLDTTQTKVTLMDPDGDGTYTGSVTISADNTAADGSKAITVTATDAADNSGTGSVSVMLDNTAPTVSALADPTHAKAGDTVMLTATVSEAATVTAAVAMLDTTQLSVDLMDADSDGTYTGSVTISADNTAADGSKAIAVTATDAAGNSGMASASVTLDNTAPEVTEVSVDPSPTRNGKTVTISATVSEASTVTADVSMLDTMQTEMVTLMDADGDGTYTGSHTISEENDADNGTHTVTVTATDDAGNSGSDTGTVNLINTIDYTSTLPAGISLFHVPIDVTAIDGEEASLAMVSDLYEALGDAVNYLITYDGTSWTSYLGGATGDAAITADGGIVAVMKAETTITFTGNAWGGDDGSMINLREGLNFVGVPVNDASVSTISSIMDLPEFAGKVTSIIALTDDGKFVMVAAGGEGDGAVQGDAAYLVTSSAAASQSVTGDGWSNGEMAGAAPVALFGHKVDNQTPALFVEGSIVDELTGLAKEGFRIKVKNLSTKAALNTISQTDVAQGYSMTFVDTNAGNAARIGDVLEISADSPDPLIGVQPVRHVVTVDDVKDSRIQLEDLVAYEIPAETALLNNYPNPFNPETWIPYHLSEDADVKLTIYDISGEVVRDIDVGHQTAAKYDTRSKAIYWDGRNRFGEQVASGIYFYHLQAGDFSGTRKMVILK